MPPLTACWSPDTGLSHMQTEELFQKTLCYPASAMTYSVSRQLALLFPQKAVIESDDSSFDLESYYMANQCTISEKPYIINQSVIGWNETGKGTYNQARNVWWDIVWEDHRLEVICLTWGRGYQHWWILADAREIAERFFLAVCEWGAEVRSDIEVLVFDEGHWFKSRELLQAIRSTTMENLVLPGTVKQEIENDFDQFFTSKAMYESYRVPWKRGVLFLGPPGNGKTHTIKALVNRLNRPCLYVKSLVSSCASEHSSIRRVFWRARQSSPCILVLEDLDSLIHDGNRSFFLNELDGFAANTGIVVLATTNHPERLDPAILERPSRFDRKYYFDLPQTSERLSYMTMWNQAMEPELQLSPETIALIAGLTEKFSYAYLKELFLSSMMRWIASPKPGGMEEIMVCQVGHLREQMKKCLHEHEKVYTADEEQEE